MNEDRRIENAFPINSNNASALRMACAIAPAVLFGIWMNLAAPGALPVGSTVLAFVLTLVCTMVNVVTSIRATEAWYFQRKQSKAVEGLVERVRELEEALDTAKGQSIEQLVAQARQIAAHRVDDPSTWVVQQDVEAPPGYRKGDVPYLELVEQLEEAKHQLQVSEQHEQIRTDNQLEIIRLLKVENQMLRDRYEPARKKITLRRKAA